MGHREDRRALLFWGGGKKRNSTNQFFIENEVLRTGRLRAPPRSDNILMPTFDGNVFLANLF